MDNDHLFLDYIYKTSFDEVPGRFSTPFAKQRDFFHSFFGTTEDIPREQVNIDRDGASDDDSFYTNVNQGEPAAYDSGMRSTTWPDSDEGTLSEIHSTVQGNPEYDEICTHLGPERPRKRKKCGQVIINLFG